MQDFIEITSKDNAVVKLVSLLQNSSKQRKTNGLFVLEGLRICSDAFDNNIKFEKLLVTKNAIEKHAIQIQNFADASKNCYILKDELFKKISDTDTPQGIIAVAKIPKPQQTLSTTGKYIALENISDPSNLGAIARSAEALGISGIIISQGGCDPYSPKSLRSSMGTLLRLPLYITDNIIEFIKRNSLRSFGCVVDKNAASILNVKFENGDVLLIGNEANGLTEASCKSVDRLITIPMSGKAESLNAAAAASIAMWEMLR